MIQELVQESKLPSRIEPKILTGPNREMLVGSLWDTWKWVQKEGIQSKYFFAVEDDWLFNHWGEREKVLDLGNIYVGMFSRILPAEENYSEFWSLGTKIMEPPAPCEGNRRTRHLLRTDLGRIWTDGGCYFLFGDSLPKIEEAIGRFNKAPEGEISCVEDYRTHGVSFGEVGFPTSLYHAGFRFTAFQECGYLTPKGGFQDFSQLNLSKIQIVPEDFYLDAYDSSGCYKLQPKDSIPTDEAVRRQSL
jgi:hypothetical protein